MKKKAAARRERRAKQLAEEERAKKLSLFEDTLYTCGPARLALAAERTSTGPHMQTIFIQRHDAEQRKRNAVEKISESGAEPTLVRLMDLQSQRGTWEASTSLDAALGGFVPDTPTGLVEWRWKR